jgi:hypothetical protein
MMEMFFVGIGVLLITSCVLAMFIEKEARWYTLWLLVFMFCITVGFASFNGITVYLNDSSWHFKLKFDPMPELPLYDPINKVCKFR